MIRYMWKIACTGIAFLGLLFGACSNEGFSVGDHLPISHITEGMTDAITIEVSNMMAADSVVTSGKSIGFSGAYIDPQIGAVQAQTYIEFSRTMDSEGDRYAKFDSITLVLRPNGEYYGDTLVHAAFRVFGLLKPIDKGDDGNMYSTSTLPFGELYADTALRVKVIDKIRYPKNNWDAPDEDKNEYERLKKIHEIEIKLPRALGEQLFQGILRDDDAYKTDRFLRTFPGLAVAPGAGSECVHGLNLDGDSACMIRIYYHISTSYKEAKTMTFKANPQNSFYNLHSEKTQLPFFNMKSDPVPSALTGNRGIIMSGSTPMYTRLEFPNLNEELLWLGQIVKVRRATLYIRPIRNSFDTVPLPPKLNVFYFDPTSNTPLSSAIKPPSMGNQPTAPQMGNLPEDYRNIQRPNFPQYSFDVTDFIASQLGKRGYEKWALSIVIPPAPNETTSMSMLSENTLQRLVFGDQKYWYRTEHLSRENQIKLEVIYVVYND